MWNVLTNGLPGAWYVYKHVHRHTRTVVAHHLHTPCVFSPRRLLVRPLIFKSKLLSHGIVIELLKFPLLFSAAPVRVCAQSPQSPLIMKVVKSKSFTGVYQSGCICSLWELYDILAAISLGLPRLCRTTLTCYSFQHVFTLCNDNVFSRGEQESLCLEY